MLAELIRRLLMVFRRRQFDADVDDEMRLHRELREQELIERGVSAEEARYAAHRRFGNDLLLREESRDMWGWNSFETLWQDVRYGLRQLRLSPGFTAAAVITLALGIGANTAIFSAVNGVLIRPLPYSDPDRLVWVTEFWPLFNSALVPSPDYLNWQDQNEIFQTVAAYGRFGDLNLNLSGSGEPERIDATAVTWNLFATLGVRPALGRAFLPEEDRPGGAPVAVLSHSLWQRHFRSDPRLVGKTITLNEKGYTVVGIMPEDFRFPADWSPELFVPANLPPKVDWSVPSFGVVEVIARLKPDVTLERVQSDLVTINNRVDSIALRAFKHKGSHLQVRVMTLHGHLVGNVRPLLLILLAAVGFVLLLACANVANLQFARAATREKEFVVRVAIGAGRWRLARQLLVESLSMAILGGVAGLIVGACGVALFRRLGPANVPGLSTVGFDPRVFAFIATITTFSGTAFGLAPVFIASHLDVDKTLKNTRPSTTAGGPAQRLRALLMVSEVALALILLTGAGLLIRSFIRISAVNPGFDPERLLTARVMLPLDKYPQPAQWTPFFQSVLDRVQTLPGVESVAAASSPPLTIDPMGASVEIEGRLTTSGMLSTTLACTISPSYFHTLRIPLVSGRDLTPYDAVLAPRVVIVNEAFVRRFLGHGDPLGHRIRLGGRTGNWSSIIGVVPSARHLPLTMGPETEVFTSYLQQPFWSMTLVVQASSALVSLEGAVRRKVQEVDRNQPVYDIATMQQRFSRAVMAQRFNALVMALFAGIAVILAAVGVYGVMAYTVTQRTHEIGIRRALGAQRQDVIKLVLRHAAALSLVGTTLGLIGALALTRFLSNLLYGVTVRDPITIVAVSLALTAVALVASYLPARRATKVDPLVALRHE